MASPGWLRTERAELAAEQILDAAGRLFADHGVAGVGMGDVAAEAGCSRATLYRYFENRAALRVAFVHRETRRIAALVAAEVDEVDDPGERVARAMTTALRLVRSDATLAAWFTAGDSEIASQLARSSEVIEGLAAAFLGDGSDSGLRKARWIVRVLVSLLAHPEDDPGDERTLIEEFVVPVTVTTTDSGS